MMFDAAEERREIDGLDPAGGAVYEFVVAGSGAIPERQRKLALSVVRDYLYTTDGHRSDQPPPTHENRQAWAMTILAAVSRLCAFDLFALTSARSPVDMMKWREQEFAVCVTASRSVDIDIGDTEMVRVALDQDLFRRFLEALSTHRADPMVGSACGHSIDAIKRDLLTGLFADNIRRDPKGRAWVVCGVVAAALWLRGDHLSDDGPQPQHRFERLSQGLVIGAPFDLYVNTAVAPSALFAGFQASPTDAAMGHGIYHFNQTPASISDRAFYLRAASRMHDSSAFQSFFEVE